MYSTTQQGRNDAQPPAFATRLLPQERRQCLQGLDVQGHLSPVSAAVSHMLGTYVRTAWSLARRRALMAWLPGRRLSVLIHNQPMTARFMTLQFLSC